MPLETILKDITNLDENKLYIKWEKLSDQDIRKICNALEAKQNKISTVDLDDISITKEGAQILGQTLRNHGLNNVKVNDIEDEEIITTLISETIKQNNNITYVNLGDLTIGNSTANLINKALENNFQF